MIDVAAMWDIAGNTKRLMLIDEPDAHIHPDLQVRFAEKRPTGQLLDFLGAQVVDALWGTQSQAARPAAAYPCSTLQHQLSGQIDEVVSVS